MITTAIMIRKRIWFFYGLIRAILLGVLFFPLLMTSAQGALRWGGVPPPPPIQLGTGSLGIAITNTLLRPDLKPLDLKCTLCDIPSAPEVQKNHPIESTGEDLERHEPVAEDSVALGWRYFQEGKFQASVEEFIKAGDALGAQDGVIAAYNAMATAALQDGRISDALDTADTLRDIDYKLGTLLRGDILLHLNALPLAVEAYQPYADDKNVQRVLTALRKSGHDRFQRLETGSNEWAAFDIQYRGADLERPVRYLFRRINGREIPAPFAYVSERPAPRGWSFKLLWWAICHWTWPETKNLKEYRLTINGTNASDIVEFWEGLPSNDEIMAAAKIGFVAADALQDAEKMLHDGQRQDAFFRLRSATGADWSISNPSRHYGALVNLTRVALAVDQREADIFFHILKYRYPYWGQLAWASLLLENNQLAEASAVLEKAADEYPLRHEALEQLVDMQWNALQMAPAERRMEMGREMQRTLSSLLSRRPGLVSARLRLAEWHLMLRAYALASNILKDIDHSNPDTEASTMLSALKAQGRDTFEELGEFTNARRGLIFRVYESLNEPAARGTIIFHAAEVVVLDSDEHHLETFALSSQALSDQGQREYFLDWITTDGLQTLIRYRNNPIPSARDLGLELAAQ